MKRVVVTGVGLVSPLGCTVESTWARMLAGKSGAVKIAKFDTTDYATKIACEVPRTDRFGDSLGGVFNVDDWVEPKEQRRNDDFIIFAMAAASQALADSGWEPKTQDEQVRTGVYIGSGIGGIQGIASTAVTLHERGPRKVSPFFIPGSLVNLASGQVSIRHGLKGPNHANANRLLDRRARDRRCGAHDHVRRRGRDARRRRRGRDLPDRHRRVQCLPSPFDSIQRSARARVAALRQGPRRLRDGRRLRRRRARGI